VGRWRETPLDASLQPGTGSTDIIVGAYYYQPISQNFDFFANAQFQARSKVNRINRVMTFGPEIPQP